MSLIRYHSGKVRVVWRVLIAVVLWVAVAFLLRFIPIILYTAVHARGDVAREEVVTSAKAIIFEHPIWSTVIGVINGLLSIPIVWFLMKVAEKRSFGWKEVGLDWRRNSPSMLGFGALLALLMYIASRVVPQSFGSSMPAVETIVAGLTVPVVIQKLVLWIPMGFGEEVLFRGYVQSRLVERHGAVRGILICSIVFTLLHLLVRPLSPVDIISGVLLSATFGTLYYFSKSLYLVGMFHGVTNVLLNTLSFEGSDAGGLIVHSLVLLLVIGIGLRRSRYSLQEGDVNGT